jgi:heme-degrading monooxygenase HmoA
MSIHSIWESTFPADAAEEGRAVTEAIWADMPGFDGYLDHAILEDADQPGHLLVVSRWVSPEAADAALSYRSHSNAVRANQLADGPRRRFLARTIDVGHLDQ